jgi:hypothetical protein
MTTGEHNVPREDREEVTTKEEEMKDPGPLDFLSELVKEEVLSPEVATSYRKLARTMVNQFHQEMKSCITFVCAENQVTRDTVTEGMKEVAEVFSEAQKEHVERMQLEMENLRIQHCDLEGKLQQRSGTPNCRSKGPKPSKPDNLSGDPVKGKEWLHTICQYKELRLHESTSDAVIIRWILPGFVSLALAGSGNMSVP